MTDAPKSPPHVDVNIGFGPEGTPLARRPGSPLSVVMLGDFSGRSTRASGGGSPAPRRLRRVDADSLPDLPGRLGTVLRVEREGREPLEIEIESLEDLSPDGLVRKVEPLRALRILRRQLLDPSTAGQARARLLEAGIGGQGPAAPERAEPRDAEQDLVASLLASPAAQGKAPDALGVDAFVTEVVGRHLEPGPSADTDDLVGRIDALLTQEVRSLLAAPATRSLEASWRALHLAADRVSLGERVTLDIIDITKDELACEMTSTRATEASGIARLLSLGGAGGEMPCDLVVQLFALAATPADAALLARLSLLSQSLGATMLCDGDARLAGCESIARKPDCDDWNGTLSNDAAGAWAACQMLPSAAHVGLVVPRVLLRAPHGAATTPADTFAFEEFEGTRRHDDLLWGSGAAACATALMAARAASDGGGDASVARELGDLPLFVHEVDGERHQVPCAEAWLSERSARVLVEAGLIPLLSVRNSTSVRVGTWRSMAQPPGPLAGRAMA